MRQDLKLKPEYVDAFVNRGSSRAGLGKFITAILGYGQAVRLQPDLVRACYNRARAKALLGHNWGAKQGLRNALEFANRFGEKNFIAKIQDAFKLVE